MLEILKSVDSKTWIGFAGVLLGASLSVLGVFFGEQIKHEPLTTTIKQ